LDLNLKKETSKVLHLEHIFYDAETLSFRQKYLGSFEMWCCKGLGKISWNGLVRNEELLHRVMGERNILHAVKRRKANWIGHILSRKCLLNHIIAGKMEGRIGVKGRRVWRTYSAAG
jgi:hypothetical protein